MVIGDSEMWSDMFPKDLIPRVLDLITNTWDTFGKPGPAEHEVPITRRFKHALKQAKDMQRLPVRIEREPVEDDPITGQELGRIDLKFLPAVSALEEVYFAFECKRLNATNNGFRRTLASEYVTEGMMRYVNGQYASSVCDGGMIGYVLQGTCGAAIKAVNSNVGRRATELRMPIPAGLKRSSLRPISSHIRETTHSLTPEREFSLHHVFLGCSGSLSCPNNSSKRPANNT